jgi:hypothetical protein
MGNEGLSVLAGNGAFVSLDGAGKECGVLIC